MKNSEKLGLMAISPIIIIVIMLIPIALIAVDRFEAVPFDALSAIIYGLFGISIGALISIFFIKD